jgi:hypothetical protein
MRLKRNPGFQRHSHNLQAMEKLHVAMEIKKAESVKDSARKMPLNWGYQVTVCR